MTVRLALVGLGYWGPNLARNLAILDNAELVALCDANEERLRRIGRQYPSARLVPSFEDVLADDTIDAVVVATPVDTHFDLCRAALAAGKHVMVEKPLATSSAECETLIELAAAKGRTLMVGHVFVYNAAVNKVKEYIDAGEIGEVYYVYSQRLNLGQVRHDVNAMWNFAPHDLSIMCHWFGTEPTDLTARGHSYIQPGIEDVVFLNMEFPKGILASVHISWLDPLKVRRMTIVGSEKMVVYDDVSADAKDDRLRPRRHEEADRPDRGVAWQLPDVRRVPAAPAGRRRADPQARLRGAAQDRVPALRRLHSHGRDAGVRRAPGALGRPRARSGPALAAARVTHSR